MLINKADDEWEWYIGMLFSKIINDFNLNNCKTILEIAPGFRYKIAYALKEINFNGTLYIIDSSKEVCDYVKEKYQEILPDATIITINDSLENVIKNLPKIDLLLGNHIIDDLIIYKEANINYKINENIQDILNLSWKNIYNTKKYLSINARVINLFKELFKKVDFCILNQYKGNVFLLDNNYEYIITKECFNKIKNMVKNNDEQINLSLAYHPFGDDERYLLPDLLANVQNSENWIVGEIYELI